MYTPEFESKAQENDFRKIRIESLGLPTRTENALLSANIRTIGGIVRKTEFSLLDIQGLGRSGLREIEIKLKDPNILLLVSNNLEENHDETSQGLNSNFKEQTVEDRVREHNNKTEVKIIEEKYFEKQEEKEFIYGTKITSLEIDRKIETILLNNNIFTVGDLLSENLEDLKKKYFLNGENVNFFVDIFNYLISRNKQIEKEQEELRKKEIELIDHLNYQLDKKRSLISNEYIKITPRNLGIFNLFRKGLTLEQIGKENNVTKERIRQVIKSTLDKLGLDYEEEKSKIYLERNEAKPKKIKKEKKWGARKYDFCMICNTIEFSHSRNGVCERCNGAFSGETREKIIFSHNNKCDNCNMTRSEAIEKYKHDLFITKEQKVFCKMCFLWKTGKKLGDSRKNKWRMFYK